MAKFKREHRYIVIKRKHLTAGQEDAIKTLLDSFEIVPINCLVVEPDWPEYEPTWSVIEKRMEKTS